MERIDPNIALGFRMPQIQDPTAAAARAQEVGVNALKMQEMQRGVESQNKLRELYSQGVDISTPEGFKQVAAIDPAIALKLRTDALQGQKLQGEIKKNEYDTENKKIKLIRETTSNLRFNPSPENIRANAQDNVLRGLWTPAQADIAVEEALRVPYNQRAAYFEAKGLDAEKSVTTRIQQGQLDLSREGQRLQYDPTRQGEIAGAKTKAQEAAKRDVAGNIDVISNRKALAQAGYDVTTGKDDITDLIKKSTGSYIGKAVDISGRAVGKSTEGSKALAALEQKAGAITFGLLNGKLGAGISNADVQLIVSLVGKVSDGTLPVEDRLASWTSAKDMMKNLGMVAEPTGSPKPTPSTPTNKTPKLPPGFKPDEG
jgi:hypothetical protein